MTFYSLLPTNHYYSHSLTMLIRSILSTTHTPPLRLFSSTPIVAVKRQQKPYKAPIPPIDKYGRPDYDRAITPTKSKHGANGVRQSKGFAQRESIPPWHGRGDRAPMAPSRGGGSGSKIYNDRRAGRSDDRFGRRDFSTSSVWSYKSSHPRGFQLERSTPAISIGGQPYDDRYGKLAAHSNPFNPSSARSKTRTPHSSPCSQSTQSTQSTPDSSAELEPWQPTKKLTYSAMDGLRALHRANPKMFDRATLSERFGISFEAVSRILKSKFRHPGPGPVEAPTNGVIPSDETIPRQSCPTPMNSADSRYSHRGATHSGPFSPRDAGRKREKDIYRTWSRDGVRRGEGEDETRPAPRQRRPRAPRTRAEDEFAAKVVYRPRRLVASANATDGEESSRAFIMVERVPKAE